MIIYFSFDKHGLELARLLRVQLVLRIFDLVIIWYDLISFHKNVTEITEKKSLIRFECCNRSNLSWSVVVVDDPRGTTCIVLEV